MIQMTATPYDDSVSGDKRSELDTDSMYLGCDDEFLKDFPSLGEKCYGVITKGDGRKFRIYGEDQIRKACIDKTKS